MAEDDLDVRAGHSAAPIATMSADQRLQLLIDAVQEYAIFMLDADGTVATWNAGARRIKGYEAADIVGRHFSVFYTDDDRRAGKPERELADAIANGQCRDEGLRVRQDGSTFWANVVITAVHEDGRLIGFAKVTRDETDRRAAESHVRRLELLTDRERIADEVREGIVRHIFEVGLALESTLRLVTDAEVTRRIEGAVSGLDATLKEIRSVVLDLGDER